MKRFLALGDSYTIGEGVTPGESWPLVMTKLLGTREVLLETRIVATTGWTTDELMEAVKADRADKADKADRADRADRADKADKADRADKADKADKADRYDLVTLLIGVNDQYRGRSLEHYRAGLKPLIQYAIDQTRALRSGRSPKAGHVFAGGERPEHSAENERPEHSAENERPEHSAENERPERSAEYVRPDSRAVIVISIPNWGRTPFAEGRDRAAIAREIANFNQVAADEAARAGCAWADIRAVQDADGDPATLLVGDRLHPSAAAYEAWAEALLPFALAALGRA